MNRFADFMASLMTPEVFNLTMSFSSSSMDLGLQINWSVFMEGCPTVKWVSRHASSYTRTCKVSQRAVLVGVMKSSLKSTRSIHSEGYQVMRHCLKFSVFF